MWSILSSWGINAPQCPSPEKLTPGRAGNSGSQDEPQLPGEQVWSGEAAGQTQKPLLMFHPVVMRLRRAAAGLHSSHGHVPAPSTQEVTSLQPVDSSQYAKGLPGHGTAPAVLSEQGSVSCPGWVLDSLWEELGRPGTR